MAWPVVALAVLSLIKALRDQDSSDGGLGAMLRYQAEMAGLTFEAVDGLIGDVLRLREDIANAVSLIDAKLEASRLQGYVDKLESCDRLRRGALAVMIDRESLANERAKAESDLEKAYVEAQLAVGMLRPYSGPIAAIAFPASLALTCTLITQTQRGPAALKHNLQDFELWANEIRNENNNGSLTQQFLANLDLCIAQRELFKDIYALDLGGPLTSEEDDAQVIKRLQFTRASDPWIEIVRRSLAGMHGEAGVMDWPEDIQHAGDEFYTLDIAFGLRQTADIESQVSRLEFIDSPRDHATYLSTVHIQLPAKTDTAGADAVTVASPAYQEFSKLKAVTAARVDAVNTARAQCNLGWILTKNMDNLKIQIGRSLELL